MKSYSNATEQENKQNLNCFEEFGENLCSKNNNHSIGKPSNETIEESIKENVTSKPYLKRQQNEESKKESIENINSTNIKENSLNKIDKEQINKDNKVHIINKKYNLFIIGIIVLIISIITSILIMKKLNKAKYIILDDEENEIFIEGDIDEIENKRYKAIISIDFGSSYSGFAIAFGENSIEAKLENIQPTTIVILKKNKEGYKYGNEAENFMNEHRSGEYIYFDRIKTKLDPKFRNEIQSKIYINSKYPSNYKINLRIIIKEYLRLFSNDALKYYNQKGNTDYSKHDIKWIVTVPAIWNEYGKQFMKNCAKKAGMNKVIIALEPEAASLTMFNDDNIDQKFKQEGKVFMLLDAGGYTLDVTVNEIIDANGNLKQLSPPSGGAYGSMNINDYLIQLVEEIFTKEKIDDLRNNRFDLWKITLDSIEKKKKELRDDGSDADYYKIDIRLEDICESNFFNWILRNNKCTKIISYGKIQYDNKYLYIPKNIMRKILLKNVSKIINHIKKLIKEFPKIDLIVLTGGFAKCILLKEEIKRNFEHPYKELIDPEISIMKGAALYGIKPNQIVSRKSPYTIGTNKYIEKERGKECRNPKRGLCQYFDKFIGKGEDIKNNQAIFHNYIPLFDNQKNVVFPLYFSKLENQIYIDGNTFKVSEFSMEVNEWNIPREKRMFELRMEFGSCITLSGKNLITGERIKIFANYYKRND